MQDRYFSDEELVAFLDGEADFAPIDDITRALKRDAALQRRLEALSLDRDALQAEFDALVPDRLIAMPPAPRPQRNGLWAAVTSGAVAAALVLGFALGSARTAQLDGWAEYVAAYQALYSNSTLAHIETTPLAQQAELDRVAASIGKAIRVEELSVFPEVDYRRAQILSFEGQALIQLAFLTSTGEPLALCVIRASDTAERMPQIARMEGLSTALWAQNGYDYVLIGGTDDALIERMAATFQGISL